MSVGSRRSGARWLTCTLQHSWKVMLAVGGRTKVLSVQVAAQGLLECPSDMVAAVSQSEQSKTARQKWQCHLLGSHTPSLLQCSQIFLLHCGRGLHRGMNARGMDCWGPS